MNEVIKLKSWRLAYCHVCGLPSTCGEFELSGWRHIFYICPSCLEKFSRKILQSGAVGVEKGMDSGKIEE